MAILAKCAFFLYTLLILAGAWWAVTAQSLVRALIGLIATLFAVAGMYLLLAAPLVAFMQVLIYVGAVSVLILLAIMLARAPAGGEEQEPRQPRQYVNALLVMCAPAFALSWVVMKNPPAGRLTPAEIPAEALGQGLMGPYSLAFELISVALLVSMAGAVLLAFEKRGAK